MRDFNWESESCSGLHTSIFRIQFPDQVKKNRVEILKLENMSLSLILNFCASLMYCSHFLFCIPHFILLSVLEWRIHYTFLCFFNWSRNCIGLGFHGRRQCIRWAVVSRYKLQAFPNACETSGIRNLRPRPTSSEVSVYMKPQLFPGQ